MDDAELLVKAFDRNRRVIQAQCEGLTHADSLLQTPYNINCLNWVIGHVLDGRSQLLDFLEAEPIVPLEQTERYRSESDPVAEDGPGVIALDELLGHLDASQELLAEALGPLGAGELSEVHEIDGHAASLLARIHFTYFHDTYHTGQTELLRQVAGKDDKII